MMAQDIPPVTHRSLTEHGYEPQCVAGTSAGAIMASLVASGYTGAAASRNSGVTALSQCYGLRARLRP